MAMIVKKMLDIMAFNKSLKGRLDTIFPMIVNPNGKLFGISIFQNGEEN